ncbi:MAG: heparan-alpha-glucosaminide N-acetyltransferase domain-containing protein [Candidatus Acidiferrales bacterium]
MAAAKERLDYIDWMRGLACLTMFQTHCYDSWLIPTARNTGFFRASQLIGTLPAPLFLFLAGVSLALVIDRLESKGLAGAQIARTLARRGLEILGLGLLFRAQEFALGYPWVPWSDLGRVDILNTIGLSLVLASGVAFARGWGRQAGVAAAVALLIALVTPPLWTTWKPDFLPWWLATYINGGHTDFEPKPWLFCLFPWSAFTFAGAAAGLALMRGLRAGRQAVAAGLLGGAGVALGALALWLDSLPVQLYAVYDFWHTSPNFFLVRVGILLMILALGYGWCAAKPGRLFSPLLQLGKTSLLVYWVHVPFVYGRFSFLPKSASSLELATFGLLIVVVAMTLLSLLRTRLKGRGTEMWSALRHRLGWARA